MSSIFASSANIVTRSELLCLKLQHNCTALSKDVGITPRYLSQGKVKISPIIGVHRHPRRNPLNLPFPV